MVFSLHVTLLLIWMTQDLGSCEDTKTPHEQRVVAFGDSLTLNCTYNCSLGFVRGCWSKIWEKRDCVGTIAQHGLCSVSLRLENVSSEDIRYNYSCYTLATDHPELKAKPELFVSLQLKTQKIARSYTVTPPFKGKNASVPTKPGETSGGEATGIQVIASVTVAMALLLAAIALYLCLSRSRHGWNGKGEPVLSCSSSPSQSHAVFSPVKGSLPSQNDRVTLRIPSPDGESDTEVPYADIMITVRGVSTPELTQVCYLSPGEQSERRRDEPRPHLQASRSADRLFVPQPREVSRKMSTSSEYAVITYA